uniref:Uncharacterized protein n=1 Tax=Anguilla anguilla TaxID=7936 RepID=A0A0E9SNW2_ANGAN
MKHHQEHRECRLLRFTETWLQDCSLSSDIAIDRFHTPVNIFVVKSWRITIRAMGLETLLESWVMDYVTRRPKFIRLQNNTSEGLISNTRVWPVTVPVQRIHIRLLLQHR